MLFRGTKITILNPVVLIWLTVFVTVSVIVFYSIRKNSYGDSEGYTARVATAIIYIVVLGVMGTLFTIYR